MEKITYYTNSSEFEADILRLCPFCGGEPEFRTIGNYHTKSRKAEIECTKCHVRRTTGAIRNNLEWCGRKAIELWNARWHESSNESAALHLHDVSGAKRKVCPVCWQPLEDGIVRNMCVNDKCPTNSGQTYR